MLCSRCGTEGNMDYGTDGALYCSSCLFFGTNKQCNKCRMYLPSPELQMWTGQLFCQYCIMDLKDKGRKSQEQEEKYASPAQKKEVCDVCGRELYVAYFIRDKKLCESCLNVEKRQWEEKGTMPPIMKLKLRDKRNSLFDILFGLLRSFIDLIFGEKKRSAEKVRFAENERIKIKTRADKNSERKKEFDSYFESKDKNQKG